METMVVFVAGIVNAHLPKFRDGRDNIKKFVEEEKRLSKERASGKFLGHSLHVVGWACLSLSPKTTIPFSVEDSAKHLVDGNASNIEHTSTTIDKVTNSTIHFANYESW